jgi:hypothetical protein
MVDPSNIRERMEIFGSCGQLVGIVDKIEGLSLGLTKESPGARGERRYIPLHWVRSIDHQAVYLHKIASDVQEQWQAHPVREGEYPVETG